MKLTVPCRVWGSDPLMLTGCVWVYFKRVVNRSTCRPVLPTLIDIVEAVGGVDVGVVVSIMVIFFFSYAKCLTTVEKNVDPPKTNFAFFFFLLSSHNDQQFLRKTEGWVWRIWQHEVAGLLRHGCATRVMKSAAQCH